MVKIEDGEKITEKDQKIDVSDADKDLQNKVISAMEADDAPASSDDDFGTSDDEEDVDDFEDKDEEEEEVDGGKDEEEEDDWLSGLDDDDKDFNFGNLDEEEEEEDKAVQSDEDQFSDEEDKSSEEDKDLAGEETSEEDKESLSDDKTSEEWEEEEPPKDLPKKVPGGEFDGYATFEDYKKAMNYQLTQSQAEAVTKHKQLEQVKEDKAKKQFNAFVQHVNKHKDFYPSEVLEDFRKFHEAGEVGKVFILNNPYLYKLEQALRKLSSNLPDEEAFELAFNIAFADEIKKQSKKKGMVEAELRAQRVNKSVSNSGKTSSATKSKYTPEQLKIAKQMGVKLE